MELHGFYERSDPLSMAQTCSADDTGTIDLRLPMVAQSLVMSVAVCRSDCFPVVAKHGARMTQIEIGILPGACLMSPARVA